VRPHPPHPPKSATGSSRGSREVASMVVAGSSFGVVAAVAARPRQPDAQARSGQCLLSTLHHSDSPAHHHCSPSPGYTQVNSALHPSGVAKSSTSFGWGKGGNVTSAGWQVTLRDPIWHVSSRSGVATLRTPIHLLLT